MNQKDELSVEKANTNVQSVERTFLLLELLAEKGVSGLSIASHVQKSGLHKSTVHRLISTVMSMGYVTQDEESRHYMLTLKTFEIGCRIVNSLSLLSIARPYLNSLSQTSGEVSHLVIPEGESIIYVYKADSHTNTFRMSSREGVRAPMYCTGVGKAILSTLDDQEILQIWNRSKRKDRTFEGGSFSQLMDQIRQVRIRGYALDNEENEPGVRCVAAPIVNQEKAAVGAISISAPVMRMDNQKILEYAQHIKHVAHSISVQMSH